MKLSEKSQNIQEYQLAGRGPFLLDFSYHKINEMSGRRAMGLDEHYTSGSLDDISELFNELVLLPVADLIAVAESTSQAFRNRFVAGQALALKGDPRIDTLDPDMISVDSWSGKLGLKESEVDAIVEQYEEYGVIKDWILKETPEYDVDLKSFKIGKYPVTHQEYLEFLKDTHYKEIPVSWPFGQYIPYYANHPVQTLSAEACIAYTKWLSGKTGRKFRLPTEAEWEYAAAGPGKLEFPWGNTFLTDHCNTVESGIFQTTPIGIFPKGISPFGCYDMAGNVEEYVIDFYKGYAHTTIIDDLVEKRGEYRVARGGSFTRFRDLARCKRRHGRYEKNIYIMGFRLAED